MPSPRGRGSAINPDQRFARLQLAYDEGEEPGRVRTQIYQDHSQSIITRNDSPDLSFEGNLNPYRGCEHGCAYCYARPTHEFLGWSAGYDFESKLMVKLDAPALLRAEFARPKYQPHRLACSGVTDPYQPIEKKFRITRGCLEVLAECRHPIIIITKNHLVSRDIDLLTELAKYQAAAVYLSITTLDPALAHKLEPRASSPAQRLEAIRQLRAAGINVGVSMAPIIPALNDEEIPAILNAAAEAGAQFVGTTTVRLPFSVKEIFTAWLEEHFPQRKDKVLGRIRDMQGETMSHPDFGKRLTGEGIWAQQIRQMIVLSMKRAGLPSGRPEVSVASFRKPREMGGQMEMELGNE